MAQQYHSLVLCHYVAAAQQLIGARDGDITVISGLTERQAVGETRVAVRVGGAGQQPLAMKQAPCVTGLPWFGSAEAWHDLALIVGTEVRDVLRAAADVVIVVRVLGVNGAAVLLLVQVIVVLQQEPIGSTEGVAVRHAIGVVTSIDHPLARLRIGWRTHRCSPMMAPGQEPSL